MDEQKERELLCEIKYLSSADTAEKIKERIKRKYVGEEYLAALDGAIECLLII